MKTTIIALLALLILTGCGRSKPKAEATAVSRWATTPLPVPPPLPDPAKTTQSIAGANNDVASAQSNIQQVERIAEKTPGAESVLPTLNSADVFLTSARQKLSDAMTQIAQLGDMLKASEDAHQKSETIMKGDIEKLKQAASIDAADKAKEVAALQKQNDDLQNEFIRQQKSRLFWAGMALLLGGAGCMAGFFYGFAPGLRLAGCFGAFGLVLIGISQLVEKIVFAGEIACGGIIVALLVYAGWHFFHHDPVFVPGGKP